MQCVQACWWLYFGRVKGLGVRDDEMDVFLRIRTCALTFSPSKKVLFLAWQSAAKR